MERPPLAASHCLLAAPSPSSSPAFLSLPPSSPSLITTVSSGAVAAAAASASSYNAGVSALPKSSHRNRTINPDISPHRAAAVVRLLRIEKGKAFTDLLSCAGGGDVGDGEGEAGYVERTLGFATRRLQDRDVRLVTELVAGVVRWSRYLDHLIRSLCSEPSLFKSMEPLLLQILRVGFYEILKLNMPSYAVVDENVKLAKAALRPGAGNLVNGILRKLLLLKDTNCIPLPKIEGGDREKARAISIIHSHPVWMVRRWIKQFGLEEALRLMDWNNREPSFSLRVNKSKGYRLSDLISVLESLQVNYEHSVMDDFVQIQTGMQTILRAGLLKQGMCAVQDESAGFVVRVVDPQPGDVITDCCAAPGGKAIFMASCLSSQGVVNAIDINQGRLRLLRETASLHGVNNVVTTIHADLRVHTSEVDTKSDKVLLDAPCSGLGVLSKRADLRWNRHFEDLEQLTCLQDELFDAASRLVKPGGVLVYSTCSIDPEENEHRVDTFLQRHPEFSVQSVHGYVPPEFISERGFFSSFPTRHRMDGAFAARLIRSLE